MANIIASVLSKFKSKLSLICMKVLISPSCCEQVEMPPAQKKNIEKGIALDNNIKNRFNKAGFIFSEDKDWGFTYKTNNNWTIYHYNRYLEYDFIIYPPGESNKRLTNKTKSYEISLFMLADNCPIEGGSESKDIIKMADYIVNNKKYLFKDYSKHKQQYEHHKERGTKAFYSMLINLRKRLYSSVCSIDDYDRVAIIDGSKLRNKEELHSVIKKNILHNNIGGTLEHGYILDSLSKNYDRTILVIWKNYEESLQKYEAEARAVMDIFKRADRENYLKLEVEPHKSITPNTKFADEVHIDGSSMQSAEQLHLYLMQELDFPSFYGMNGDALWDCITGFIDTPILVTWKNFDDSLRMIGPEAQVVLEVFQDAEIEGFVKLVVER